MKNNKKPLGRGLNAMLSTTSLGSSTINEIEINKIYPNPDQPRKDFDENSLQELAQSIKAIGLIQPITVRKMADDSYMIISGERRWRASMISNLESIPTYIRTADDEQVKEMALIENIQREDLNSIEIALAYQSLLESTNMKQEELASRVGKNRTTISNFLRLLRLPAEIQLGLTQKNIDMGHARTLLSLPSPTLQLELYAKIVKEKMSVREVEAETKCILRSLEIENKNDEPKKEELPDMTLLSEQLSSVFATKVQLVTNQKGKGKMTIHFSSEEELARILARIEK